MVTHMNLKWRIILCICLVIVACLPMVSAAIQVPTTKYSFNRPSLDLLKTAQFAQYTRENIGIYHELPDIQVYHSPRLIRKPDFSAVTTDPAMPGTTNSVFEGWRIPRTIPNSGIYITGEHAIAIALVRFPGIELTEPIRATLERIDAPAFPLATNPCWAVEIAGRNPEVWGTSYGGIVFIDALTGEVLYTFFLM